ncbi:GNVR domain-containing protein [Hoeflea sp. YIM 152468]|uniref:GumC family protein n=1 Tax=Hoeflea sp. YIM 152468 TaxID=3031759 RepID=UPI0023D9EBD5|nr:GNVR domain-containing protein [Hoeflea sp. YIM 152468]MDF1610129.1 GNVR domain-containing protein [Hoeflea sp. YIM 152468]
MWRFRYLIGAATVAGAVLGVVMALATPHRYYAESRLFVDPREIRVTEDDVRNQQLSTEAVLAITDSQLQILSSTSVLEKVVADLGLDRDPEFNGSLSRGGIRAGWQQIKQIFTGEGGPSEEEQKALNHLRDAVSVARDAKTFVIIVGVDTLDPDKSALIANQIVETYLDSEGQAQSNLLERTSESIDTRINSLRTDLDLAEREVERYKAENGLVGVGGQFIDDKVILALSEQLANARAMKIGIRVKADNLARVNIDEVLSGAFPEELLSSNLTELRKQYTQTKSSAESLATQLGPRHPQYIAALSSLETIKREISAELRRIVASSQTELQRAVQTEQELASQMAVAKSRAMDQSVELVTLRELERKAAATRGIYEAFLTRSRETSERSNLSTRNVRVISPAEAPLRPMGPSRKFIAAGGMVAGFLSGVGLALLAGAVESFTAYNGGAPQARFQTPPYGGYPGPQGPAPHTPPGGSGPRGWRGRDEESTGLDAAADEATAAASYGARATATAGGFQSRPAHIQPDRARQEAVEAAPPSREATTRQTGPRHEPTQQPTDPADHERPHGLATPRVFAPEQVGAPQPAPPKPSAAPAGDLAVSFAQTFDPSPRQHQASEPPASRHPECGCRTSAGARAGQADPADAGQSRPDVLFGRASAARAPGLSAATRSPETQAFAPVRAPSELPHPPAQPHHFAAAPQMQPLWSAIPAQPQYPHPAQPQPQAHSPGPPQVPAQPASWPDPRHQQPAYPFAGYQQPDPYAAMPQQGAPAGYAAAPVAMAQAYPMPDPRMTPLQAQPHFHPQTDPVAWSCPVQPSAVAPQLQAAQSSVPVQPMQFVQPPPTPIPAWQQPAPPAAIHPAALQAHAATAFQQPAAQAAAPLAQPSPPVRPANDAAVERIRRDMDGLRARISGYGTQRRRA